MHDLAIKAENTRPVDYAIKVNGVSKTFRIPHEKITSLRGAFVSAFSRDKGYEEFKAVDDVSFEVKKGEFFGIIGRNGSGKSTLLKILAGIYQPDKGGGRVKVNGLISPFLELGIGFNPELSGRDNVYLNAAVLGLSHKQIEEKFDDIVRFSELKRFIDQKVKNYSSGMQVRLAFSVAIHANRDILLMDEVLAVGDGNFQSKCLEEFSRYKDLGKTVVLVSHDILTVQKYCDRVMLLREGKIHMIGSPEKVGNEYIYQNMSDEEKRLVEEEKERRIKAEKELERRKKEEKDIEQNQRMQAKIEKYKEVEKEREKKRNKVAKITGVEFLDKNGNKKNVFETGDDLSVRVYFKRNKKVDALNFGLGIFSQENYYAFGINTFIDKVDTKRYVEREYCQVDYNNIQLKTNTYYIGFAIYGENDKVAYDYIPKLKTFKIFSKDNNFGIVNIDYKWN